MGRAKVARVKGKVDAIGVREFARRVGVTHAAVQRAIRTGRVTAVRCDARGRVVAITDPEKAVREWVEHTRPRVATGQKAKAGENGQALPAPSALALATQRERDARARLAELEYARKVGELVLAREVEIRWTERIVQARNQMLALPTRAKARLPQLSASDVTVLDALVREALEELATTPPSRGREA